MPSLQPAVLLLCQLSVILATCRAVGWLGRRFLGQTQVVMEMVAGVLLGPSFLGLVAPRLQAWLFPRELPVPGGVGTVPHPSMAVLFALSQLGLVLYMFLVGLEFDVGQLRGRMKSAGSIAAAGVAVPFLFGAGLALAVRQRGDLFSAHVSGPTAALFLGAAMSITAFPMLARILHERGLAGTRMGAVALAAGSLGDAIAWCLLAVVLATVNATPVTALVTIGGGLAYGAVMALGGRPLLRHFQTRYEVEGRLTVGTYTLLVLVVLTCALLTDAFGLYTVFGAFVAGLVMPREGFAVAVAEKTQLLVTSVLLPVFFVYSGLNTRIGLVNTAELWRLTGVVVLLAVAGKGVACALAARAGGEGWREAAIIGALMNARGLMELILLAVGLEHGVITPTLFTILALMAVVTTLLTSPLFRLLSPAAAARGGGGGG
jgi:K+:H+ antiporter